MCSSSPQTYPSLKLSSQKKCSPRRQYKRCQTTARKKEERDSRVKKIHSHCLNVYNLEACAATQAIRRWRRAAVKGGLTYGRSAHIATSHNRSVHCSMYRTVISTWCIKSRYRKVAIAQMCETNKTSSDIVSSRADAQIMLCQWPAQFASDVWQDVYIYNV